MSLRTQMIVDLLAKSFPDFLVIEAASKKDLLKQSGCEQPVIAVFDGIAQGFHVALHGNDCDDIDTFSTAIYIALRNPIVLEYENDSKRELFLSFDGMKPILDDADFRTGELISYTTIERFALEAA